MRVEPFGATLQSVSFAYLPTDPSGKADPHSMITTLTSLETSRFTLDVSGVLGLFGGDAAISAMTTLHVHKGRQWLGWYNTPGSYQIAKKYGLAATSSVFKALFPGTHTDPAKVFDFDGWQGPRFQGIHSGTILDSTDHLASVLMKECASLESREHFFGRQGSDIDISIVTLNSEPAEEVDLERLSTCSPFFAIFPITFSIAGCITSGLLGDWFAFSSILLGILSNGIFCLVIGSGTIRFTHHTPAAGSPPGDGILGSRDQFVLLRGEESAVNSITRGKFSLKFPSESDDGYIGYCSILFTIQFVAQLFLIPQASLLGQIMFVSSFAASWVYNLALSAYDKEKIQRQILLDQVLRQERPLEKHTFRTRTIAAVFALCVLLHDGRARVKNGTPAPRESTDHQDDVLCYSPGGSTLSSDIQSAPLNPYLLPRSLEHHNNHRVVASRTLEAYLPNDTEVWRKWKETLLERLCTTGVLRFRDEDWDVKEYTDEQRFLLETLCGYAERAYDVYENSVNRSPD